MRRLLSSASARPRVLVTGAGRGIGQATALQFANVGYAVIALDKCFKACTLPKTDGFERVEYDLRDIKGIRDLCASLGSIDTLVNNAGVLHCPPTDRMRDVGLGFTDDQSNEILTVNLRAPIALVEALAPQMIARAEAQNGIGGRIVNIASVSAFTGHPDLFCTCARL